MIRCRACKMLKWRGDVCPNAYCPRNTQPSVRLKSKTLPITATAKHGYHAGTAQTRLLSDYDMPIRSKGWR